MISNYVLRTKIDALKKKKRALSLRKQELQEAFRECGVSKNQAYKLNKTGGTTLDEGVVLNRKRIGAEMRKIETEFAALNDELRKYYSEEEAERNNSLMEVFREIFTQTQIIEIKEEATSRREGNPAKPVSFSLQHYERFKDDFYKYRELSKDTLSKMIEFRILLTGLIEKGCDQFGNAEFLKFISPLNNLIIPLKELEKIRKDYHL